MWKSRFSGLLLAVICFWLFVPKGHASPSSYYLSTSRMAIPVHPGSHLATGVIKVSSHSTEKIKLRVIPRQWNLNADGSIRYIPDNTAINPLLDTLNINPTEFELLPGKSRLVRFALKLPESFHNAEFRFQLAFEPVSVKNFESPATSTTHPLGVQQSIDIVSVFTTTVYVTEGTPKPQPTIRQFTCRVAGQPAQQGSSRVHMVLENTGEQHARLWGNVLLSRQNPAGKYEAVRSVPVNRGNLILAMPGSARILDEPIALPALTEDAAHYKLELRLLDERNLQPVTTSVCIP